MKVLHVINSLEVGGAERLLTVLLPELKKQGVDVELLLLNKGNEALYDTIEREGVPIHCLNVGKLRNPLITLKLIPFFRQGYDIIHAHLFPTQYWITLAKLLSNKSQTKLVFTEHNTTNTRISSKVYSMLDKWFYKGLDHLVCITDEIKNIYLAYQKQLEGHISIIHNGVPIEAIKNSLPIENEHLPVESQDRILLQVSGFRLQKQQETLVESLKYLPRDFKVLFAGDGERKQEIEELAEIMGLKERVYFLGVRNDVYALQKSVDYIVLSTHYEGLSLACIEGMASGKPFLASDVKGVHNLVEGAGILFQEGNAKELAKEIMRLEEDPAYKEQTIRNCQERASRYSISECARKHKELYQDLASHNE